MRKAALALAFIAGIAGTASAQVRVTVGHFAPFADTVEGTAVDIAVNGFVALTGVQFGEFTPGYVELGTAGTYSVDIFPSGSDTAAISFEAALEDGDYTLLASGDGVNQDLQIIALVDDNTPPAAGNVKIRVVHAAPFAATEAATAVSIRTDAGDIVGGLGEVPFPVASGYLEVPAGTYDLKVSSPDGSLNFIDPEPVAIPDGAIVTVVATGDGVNQPLGITALPLSALPLENTTDRTASGLFFDPAIPGQGIQSIVFPRQDRIVGYLYTFDIAGDGQAWYYFDSTPGTFDGITADVEIYQATGGAFNDAAAAVTLTETGAGTITLTGCDNVTFSGDIGNGAGDVTLTYERLGDRQACSAALTD